MASYKNIIINYYDGYSYKILYPQSNIFYQNSSYDGTNTKLSLIFDYSLLLFMVGGKLGSTFNIGSYTFNPPFYLISNVTEADNISGLSGVGNYKDNLFISLNFLKINNYTKVISFESDIYLDNKKVATGHLFNLLNHTYNYLAVGYKD